MDTVLRIDRLTIAGLALLLLPLTTMAHEIAGHAATCAATGGSIKALGAFYVQCDSPGDTERRLVALAGVGVDTLLALLFWRIKDGLRHDTARLAAWYCWLCFAFSASGYFLFSGIANIGDLGPSKGGGLATLPQPMLWRAAFALGGGYVYWRMIRAGIRSLTAMIGQGSDTRAARRVIGLTFYLTMCCTAVLIGLLNPLGLFITLASAAAATFGGKSGLISIGFSARGEPAARPFVIARSWLIISAGLAATLAFALILGPTIRFA